MISNVQYCAVSSGSQLVEEENIQKAEVDEDDRVYWYYLMDPLMKEIETLVITQKKKKTHLFKHLFYSTAL